MTALALLDAAERTDPDLAVILLLAAVTGARRGELCALRWSDIAFATGTVTFDLLLEFHAQWATMGKTDMSKRRIRRMVAGAAMTGAVVLTGAGPAFAHFCRKIAFNPTAAAHAGHRKRG